MSDSLQLHGLYPARLLCPWNSPGKNTEVGCHSLLQRIFLVQEWNPSLLHCSWIFYLLIQQGRQPVQIINNMILFNSFLRGTFNEVGYFGHFFKDS